MVFGLRFLDVLAQDLLAAAFEGALKDESDQYSRHLGGERTLL